MKSRVDAPDWSAIPVPVDDGASRHLIGSRVASISLPSTDGGHVDLSALRGQTVVYAYPRTGKPGVPNPNGWDVIPGARGCTPQVCSFRDHYAELKALDVCVYSAFPLRIASIRGKRLNACTYPSQRELRASTSDELADLQAE